MWSCSCWGVGRTPSLHTWTTQGELTNVCGHVPYKIGCAFRLNQQASSLQVVTTDCQVYLWSINCLDGYHCWNKGQSVDKIHRWALLVNKIHPWASSVSTIYQLVSPVDKIHQWASLVNKINQRVSSVNKIKQWVSLVNEINQWTSSVDKIHCWAISIDDDYQWWN